MHHIQKSILKKLTFQEAVRFAALKPQKVESNLYSYHLKSLIKDGFVKKTANGYTLDTKGLLYVDHLSQENFEPRSQSKIITILVVENCEGKILLVKRTKQPFINQWALPSGKIHLDDESIKAAALREAHEKLGLKLHNIRHIGHHYIKHTRNQEIISSVFGLVFFATVDYYESPNTLWWEKAGTLLPGTKEVIALALKHKKVGLFIEETTTYS